MKYKNGNNSHYHTWNYRFVYLLSANYHSIWQKFHSDFFDISYQLIWWLDNCVVDFCFYLGILRKKKLII